MAKKSVVKADGLSSPVVRSALGELVAEVVGDVTAVALAAAIDAKGKVAGFTPSQIQKDVEDLAPDLLPRWVQLLVEASKQPGEGRPERLAAVREMVSSTDELMARLEADAARREAEAAAEAQRDAQVHQIGEAAA